MKPDAEMLAEAERYLAIQREDEARRLAKLREITKAVGEWAAEFENADYRTESGWRRSLSEPLFTAYSHLTGAIRDIENHGWVK